MSKASQALDIYLARFAGWLRLFPQSFQKRYAKEMLLLLQDQLIEAEHNHIPLAQAYAGAIVELPSAILAEHLKLITIGSGSPKLWRELKFIIFTLLLSLGVISTSLDEGHGLHGFIPATSIILFVLLVFSHFWRAYRQTHRFFLSLTPIVVGLLSLMLAVIPDGLVPAMVLALISPHITYHLLLSWHRRRQARFAKLSQEQKLRISLLRENIRRASLIFLGALVLLPQAAGLYDPGDAAISPTDSIRQELRARLIDPSINAWYVLAQIPLSASDETSFGDTISYSPPPYWATTFDIANSTSPTAGDIPTLVTRLHEENTVAKFFADTEKTRSIIHEARGYSRLQEPALYSAATTVPTWDAATRLNLGILERATNAVLIASALYFEAGNTVQAKEAFLDAAHLASLRTQTTDTFAYGKLGAFAKLYSRELKGAAIDFPSQETLLTSWETTYLAQTESIYIGLFEPWNEENSGHQLIPGIRYLPFYYQENRSRQKAMQLLDDGRRELTTQCDESYPGFYPSDPRLTDSIGIIRYLFRYNGATEMQLAYLNPVTQAAYHKSWRCSVQTRISELAKALSVEPPKY